MDARAYVIVAVIFLLLGLHPLLALIFGWPMKWRSMRTGQSKYPMSAAGKLAAAAFPLVLAFWVVAYGGKVDATGYSIGIPVTIIAIAIEVSDVRRAKKSKKLDSGSR